MYGECCDVVRFNLDLNVETECRYQQPVQLMLLRTQAVGLFVELKQRAIINDLAIVITPDNIGNKPGPEFRNIPGNKAIEKRTSVPAGDAILLHRRQVHYRAAIAHCKVLGRYLVDDPRYFVSVPGHPLFVLR